MPRLSWPPYPRRSLTLVETEPKSVERLASDDDTEPLAGSIDAVETNTGLFASDASDKRGMPEKLASIIPGCERSYDARPPRFTSQLLMLVDQVSVPRQLCGTSYFGPINDTGGDRSARTPLPSRH